MAAGAFSGQVHAQLLLASAAKELGLLDVAQSSLEHFERLRGVGPLPEVIRKARPRALRLFIRRRGGLTAGVRVCQVLSTAEQLGETVGSRLRAAATLAGLQREVACVMRALDPLSAARWEAEVRENVDSAEGRDGLLSSGLLKPEEAALCEASEAAGGAAALAATVSAVCAARGAPPLPRPGVGALPAAQEPVGLVVLRTLHRALLYQAKKRLEHGMTAHVRLRTGETGGRYRRRALPPEWIGEVDLVDRRGGLSGSARWT